MLYLAIRYLLIAGLLVAVIVMLAGRRPSSVPFEQVSAEVAGRISSDHISKSSARYLKKNFGLNADDYDGVLIYTPNTNMSAEEVLLIRLKDLSQSDEVTGAIEERIASQYRIFEGYAPDQVALLDRSVVDVQANYILYIVGDDAGSIDEVFRKSL